MTDSESLDGARPVALICDCCESLQLSLDRIKAEVWSCNSSVGSARGIAIPKVVREGPIPRMSTVLFCAPVIMKPQMSTSSCVNTRTRDALLRRGCEVLRGVM